MTDMSNDEINAVAGGIDPVSAGAAIGAGAAAAGAIAGAIYASGYYG